MKIKREDDRRAQAVVAMARGAKSSAGKHHRNQRADEGGQAESAKKRLKAYFEPNNKQEGYRDDDSDPGCDRFEFDELLQRLQELQRYVAKTHKKELSDLIKSLQKARDNEEEEAGTDLLKSYWEHGRDLYKTK